MIDNEYIEPIAIKIPILTRKYISLEEERNYVPKLNCTGKDVYIGIVTTEDINFSHDDLIFDNGNPRVRCIWEEEKNMYYLPDKEDVTRSKYKANRNADKTNIINSDNNVDETYVRSKIDDTQWMLLAGGSSDTYGAIAKDAEFIVAKVQPAPQEISKNYTDDNDIASSIVCLKDIVIGVEKIVEIAKLNGKPVVIYIPYSYVLPSLSGLNKYDKRLREIASTKGVTLVSCSGEEADKSHRSVIKGRFPKKVNIECKKQKGIINAVVNSETGESFDIAIRPYVNGKGAKDEKEIYINEKGEFPTEYGLITSQGMVWKDEGEVSISFKIVQEKQCIWEVVLKGDRDKIYDININLAQGRLSEQVKLSGHTPSDTINPGIYKWGCMGVGSFDEKSLVTLRSSGRGAGEYSSQLDCVASGRLYLGKSENRLDIVMEGTSVAASKLVGTIALLYEHYEKQIESENGIYNSSNLPNTKMMRRWVRNQLLTLSGQSYPNINQGYGILNPKKLSMFIDSPSV